MQRDPFGGIVLVLGALIGVGIMAAHPTADDVTGAAVASGFMASPLRLKSTQIEGPARDILHNLRQPVGLMNQGFARAYVVAVAAGMLAWGLAIVRSGRMSKLLGIAALVVVHMKLDVHGFGLVTIVEAAWLVAVGVALMRGEAS